MMKRTPKIRRLIAACAAGALLAFSPSVALAQTHSGSIGKAVAGPNGDSTTPMAHVGDTVTATLTYQNTDGFGDQHQVNSIVDRVFHDSGTVDSANLLAAPVILNVGETVTRVDTYTVLPGDAVNPPHFLADENRVSGVDLGTGLPFTLTFQAFIRILRPAISIEKECELIGTPENPIIQYTFTVENTGDTTLYNVTVVDDNGTPGDTSDDVTFPIPDLAVGDTHSETSTYVATVNPSVNTVVAKGFDILGLTDPAGDTVENAGRVTDTDNCTVEIPCNPVIDVDKICEVVGDAGSLTVLYSGTVYNIGNVTLTGITVVDDKGGAAIPIPDLAPGESWPYAGSYPLPPETPCDVDVTDTVTATGTFASICPPIGGGHTVSDTATAVCSTPPCPPDVDIIKDVACALPGDTCGTFGDSATGVKNSECPSFCYQIKIVNTGPVALTSATVNDTLLGDISADFAGYFPLAVGAETPYVTYTRTLCEDTPNIATVVAVGEFGGEATDSDNADAFVETLDIVCVSLVADPDSITESGNVSLTLTLQNNGTVPLNITALNGLPALIDCETSVAIEPASLVPVGPVAAGASVVIPLGCVYVECPTTLELSITADAEVYDETGELCLYDGQGNLITDSSDPCTETVTCVPRVGTGTPGYWMNHPEAWCIVDAESTFTLCVGGREYTRDYAIQLMKAPVAKDKRYTLWQNLMATLNNLCIGTNPECIEADVQAAIDWLCEYAPNFPEGPAIEAKSATWKEIEAVATKLDMYNNGLLCAPSRDSLE